MGESQEDKRSVILILCLVAFAWLSKAEAKVTITESMETEKGAIVFVTIHGTISPNDVEEMKRIVSQRRGKLHDSYTVTLNSRGGDLEAAIEIGRILRKVSAMANIPDQSVCYSSCVFVFAGATTRLVLGDVGIHRPYLATTDARDFDVVQKRQRALAEKAKNYLAEVNVFPQLYDAMVAVPPERLKVLSIEEQHQYGLVQKDPVSQELEDAENARAYGLSKQEYLYRKAKIEDTCGRDVNVNLTNYRDLTTIEKFVGSWEKCVEDILRGADVR